MRLEKIIIDGQTYYREVADDAPTPKHTTRTKGSDAFAKAWQVVSTIIKKGACLFDMAKHCISLIGKKGCTACESCEVTRSTDEVLSLLPHMDEVGRHKVYLRLFESPEHLGGAELSAVLVYFADEERDALFLRFAPMLSRDALIACAQSVSERCRAELVSGYLEGKYRELDIRSLYPYLSTEDIERLRAHFTKE